MRAFTITSTLGSCFWPAGAPAAVFQSVVLWQLEQSAPFIGGCVQPGTGNAGYCPPTSWHLAQPLVMPAWSKPAGFQAVVLWQLEQSVPFVAGCVRPATGSA